jgi:hypothetical protein
MLSPGNTVNMNLGTGIFTFLPIPAGFCGKLCWKFPGILLAKGTKELRETVRFTGKFRDTMSGPIQHRYGYIGGLFIGVQDFPGF